jgi:uncharacterized protein
MQMNVSQLLQEAVGSTREYDIDEQAAITGDGKKSAVRGQCHFLRLQKSILVNCNLDTVVDLTCSRCLGQFRHPAKIKFEEEFVPTVDVTSGTPLAAPEEASTFTIDEHHIIDLTEAVRQYLVMALPMKALCHQDCAGLCQTCGKDLNKGPCDCPPQEIDVRWSELAKLRQQPPDN